MKKIIVKISTPFDSDKIRLQVNPNLLSKYSFEIDNDCDVCDYWLVWGDLPVGKEKLTVKCPERNVLYITDEAYVDKKFDQQFLNQFSAVITCRNDVSHRNIIKTHEINIWQLYKPFSKFNNSFPIKKEKKLSVVCSDKLYLEGHKKRYAFVNKMIGHFKDRVDAFGPSFTPLEDKWDALAPYKYSIAIENSALPGYFTEKITECYLAHTFPIYYGAPDINIFFDNNSFLTIDIDDYLGSIKKIEKMLEDDSWEKSQHLLIEQKLKYLSEFHFFSALSKIFENNIHFHMKHKRISVKSHRSYRRYYKIKKIFFGISNRLNEV